MDTTFDGYAASLRREIRALGLSPRQLSGLADISIPTSLAVLNDDAWLPSATVARKLEGVVFSHKPTRQPKRRRAA